MKSIGREDLLPKYLLLGSLNPISDSTKASLIQSLEDIESQTTLDSLFEMPYNELYNKLTTFFDKILSLFGFDISEYQGNCGFDTVGHKISHTVNNTLSEIIGLISFGRDNIDDRYQGIALSGYKQILSLYQKIDIICQYPKLKESFIQRLNDDFVQDNDSMQNMQNIANDILNLR